MKTHFDSAVKDLNSAVKELDMAAEMEIIDCRNIHRIRNARSDVIKIFNYLISIRGDYYIDEMEAL